MEDRYRSALDRDDEIPVGYLGLVSAYEMLLSLLHPDYEKLVEVEAVEEARVSAFRRLIGGMQSGDIAALFVSPDLPGGIAQVDIRNWQLVKQFCSITGFVSNRLAPSQFGRSALDLDFAGINRCLFLELENFRDWLSAVKKARAEEESLEELLRPGLASWRGPYEPGEFNLYAGGVTILDEDWDSKNGKIIEPIGLGPPGQDRELIREPSAQQEAIRCAEEALFPEGVPGVITGQKRNGQILDWVKAQYGLVISEQTVKRYFRRKRGTVRDS